MDKQADLQLESYDFSNVYYYASMIQDNIEAETGIWNFNDELLVSIAVHFNKFTLLHLYIYTTIYNYYLRLIRKYDYDTFMCDFERIIELYKKYRIKFDVRLKIIEDADDVDNKKLLKWFNDNENSFDKVLEKLTEEVFYILFSNKPLLYKFNELIIDNIQQYKEDGMLSFHNDKLDKNDNIKRCNIPKWVKRAVFYRDRGCCVFCNKDLTGIFNYSDKNFDHIISLAEGGVNDPCNIQLSCEHCNKSKKEKLLKPKYKYQKWW